MSCDPARNQLFDLTNKLIQDKSHLLSLRSVGARGAGSTLGLWRAQLNSPTCWRFCKGPPLAQDDPAPLAPKVVSSREKTCFVPVYLPGPKVSPLAGSRVVGATTVNVLLN